MFRRVRFAVAVVALVPGVVWAQHGGSGEAPTPTAPAEARQHDFLIGQWELTVKVPASGLAQRLHGTPKLVGTWKAWRAFDGFGIEDELRITDAAGNPMSLNHAMRYYDRTAKQWVITGLDVYRGKVTTATAAWAGGRMEQNSRGTDPEGKAYLNRSRFGEMSPTSFVFRQERSYDEGKKWTETLTIEAKRVAAVAPR